MLRIDLAQCVVLEQDIRFQALGYKVFPIAMAL